MKATLHRRKVVEILLTNRNDLLVVAGLGSTAWDISAAGDTDLNFPLWGAMGNAAMFGLGLALAQPKRRVLVLTGDGEMLMGMGSLATIGVQKPRNLARDSRVALSIADATNPYWYVQIRGKVVEVTTEGAWDHICKMNEKYLGKLLNLRDEISVDARVTLEITPEELRAREATATLQVSYSQRSLQLQWEEPDPDVRLDGRRRGDAAALRERAEEWLHAITVVVG